MHVVWDDSDPPMTEFAFTLTFSEEEVADFLEALRNALLWLDLGLPHTGTDILQEAHTKLEEARECRRRTGTVGSSL